MALSLSVFLGPRLSEQLTQSVLTSIEERLMVRAGIGDWHLDPLHHALVFHDIELADDRGPLLAIQTLHLQLEGLFEGATFAPHYRVELLKPFVQLTRSPDGSFQLGGLKLPPEKNTEHPFPLPHGVKISQGEFRLMEAQGEGLQLIKLQGLHGQLTLDTGTGGLALALQANDDLNGHYDLRVNRSSGQNPLSLALAIQTAKLETWKDLAPPSIPWQPVSGEISGQVDLTMPPSDLSLQQLALTNFKGDQLLFHHQAEPEKVFSIEHLEARHLSIEPSVHHYRAEGVEVLHVEGPKDHVDRISAPLYDSEAAPLSTPNEPIRLMGMTHVQTHISEMTLEGLHPRDAEDLFRLDAMGVRSITGPRVNADRIDFKEITLDPHAGLITASSGESEEIAGVFGTLTALKGQGVRLFYHDERLSLDRLDFGQSHTQSFMTKGGYAEGIDWLRADHEITIHHTHLDHSNMMHLWLDQLDALESHFDTPTKRLHMQQLTARQGEVRDDASSTKPPLKVHEVILHHYHSDALAAHWGADFVEINDAQMEWVVSPDNQFEVKGLKLGLGKPGTSSDPKAPVKHWTYEISALTLNHSAVNLTDLGTTPPTRIALDDLRISLDDLDSRANDDSDIDAFARIGSRGSLAVSGRLARNPLRAAIRIDLQKFRLALLAPYWNSFSRLQLKRGFANINGELRIIPGEEHHVEFEGDGFIDELETRDPVSGRNILCTKKLTLDDVAISSHPKRFYTRVMDWEEAYLHLVLKKDHHLNLSELFRVADPVSVPTEIKAMQFEPSPVHEPPHAAIGLVRFHNSRVDYIDLGFKPQLSTSVRDLSGTLRGLSSRRDASADISLFGKINRYSPVRLSGTIEPMDYQDQTDLLLDFTGLNLTSFPQYAGRFSGYRVARGKLNLDLHYQINQSVMNIENRATIDRLTLGEKIEDAHHPLVDLALWMLMDNRGNLDIDLPVFGDLENPSYELGTLYGQALVQFFGKVFSTPATLVQDLIPAAHEIQTIPFEAGQREVNPSLLSSLSRVIAEYKDQEGGVIEITPTANPKTDGTALADEALKQELKEAYRHDQRLAKKPVPSREETHLTDHELKKQFTRYFKEHHPEQSQKLNLSVVDDATESTDLDLAWQHALEEWRTSPDLLLDLAEDRADSIRARLVRDYDIDDGSIFLRQVEYESERNPIPVKVEYFSD